jgi:hypothetical protein
VYGVTIDGVWISNWIYWTVTLRYSSWLYFTIHYYTHTSVHIHVFTSRCSVAASNGGRSPSSGFPKCPRHQLPASLSRLVLLVARTAYKTSRPIIILSNCCRGNMLASQFLPWANMPHCYYYCCYYHYYWYQYYYYYYCLAQSVTSGRSAYWRSFEVAATQFRLSAEIWRRNINSDQLLESVVVINWGRKGRVGRVPPTEMDTRKLHGIWSQNRRTDMGAPFWNSKSVKEWDRHSCFGQNPVQGFTGYC